MPQLLRLDTDMSGFHDCHGFGDRGGQGWLLGSALCVAALNGCVTLFDCVGVPSLIHCCLLWLRSGGVFLRSGIVHYFDPAEVHSAALVAPDAVPPRLDRRNAICLVLLTLLLLLDLAQAIVASLINLVYAGLDGAHCVDLFFLKIEVRICQFPLGPDSDRLCL